MARLRVTVWEVEPGQKCGEHPVLGGGWGGAVWGVTLPAVHLRPLTWIKQGEKKMVFIGPPQNRRKAENSPEPPKV